MNIVSKILEYICPIYSVQDRQNIVDELVKDLKKPPESPTPNNSPQLKQAEWPNIHFGD